MGTVVSFFSLSAAPPRRCGRSSAFLIFAKDPQLLHWAATPQKGTLHKGKSD
jgi:hypothetical protein